MKRTSYVKGQENYVQGCMLSHGPSGLNRIKYAFSVGRKILTAYDLASPVVNVYSLQNVTK